MLLQMEVEQVAHYDCVICLRKHYEDTEAVLFEEHQHQKSLLAGIGPTEETLLDRAARYGVADSVARALYA